MGREQGKKSLIYTCRATTKCAYTSKLPTNMDTIHFAPSSSCKRRALVEKGCLTAYPYDSLNSAGKVPFMVVGREISCRMDHQFACHPGRAHRDAIGTPSPRMPEPPSSEMQGWKPEQVEWLCPLLSHSWSRTHSLLEISIWLYHGFGSEHLFFASVNALLFFATPKSTALR